MRRISFSIGPIFCQILLNFESCEISVDANQRDSVLECASVLALFRDQARLPGQSAKTLAHSKTVPRLMHFLSNRKWFCGPSARLRINLFSPFARLGRYRLEHYCSMPWNLPVLFAFHRRCSTA